MNPVGYETIKLHNTELLISLDANKPICGLSKMLEGYPHQIVLVPKYNDENSHVINIFVYDDFMRLCYLKQRVQDYLDNVKRLNSLLSKVSVE